MLNGDQLGQEIADMLMAGQTGLSEAERAAVVNAWKVIAGKIVTHIITNAVVNVTTSGATGTGPYGGPLPITAQPGVGTVS